MITPETFVARTNNRIAAIQRLEAHTTADELELWTLQLLLDHLGRNNAITLDALAEKVGRLVNRPVKGKEIQNTVLARSRTGGANHFIGTGRTGVYIFQTPEDVKTMRDFYVDRIAKETTNLATLDAVTNL